MILNSGIWNRVVGPVLFALALAATIELAIEFRYAPSFWQKTTWLVHDPYRGEPFDRVELFERLRALEDTRPEIISVGDSSGFFTLQSTIVNRYTHGAYYLSLNTGANYAYLGYRALAEYMLRRPNNRIKWVILYAYPQLLPEEYVINQSDLAPYVNDALVGPLSIATPPSAFLSPYAKFKIFNGFRWHFSDPMDNAPPALQLRDTAKQSLGWLPEFDVPEDRVNGQFPFFSDARSEILAKLHLMQSSSIYAVYDDFNRMVKSYGAHLAIAFAPISERAIFPDDPRIADAEVAMATFSREHPDVKFLFPLVSRWHPEKFGRPNHVAREYTFLSSMRLGQAIGRLVDDPDSFPTYTSHYKAQPLQTVTHQINGPADADLLESAFAFYLYTQTLDERYRARISKRILALLENDQAYQYMMEDTRARLELLAKKQVKIGYDLSKMRARPLSVSGLPHCDQQPGTQWVQVDGILQFTYKSPREAPNPEPVVWPETSNIDIPLIKEDGIYKFDGYCPENVRALDNLSDPLLQTDK